jgi:hypothetical protein
MVSSAELNLKVTGFNQNMVADMAACWRDCKPFYFFGYQYTVIFYEVTRDMDNNIKHVNLTLRKLL